MRRVLPVLLAALSAACGYHIAGRADLLPRNIKTIAIPAFGNSTMRYKLARTLPEDLAHEFLARTRYEIVADPNEADAVLTGSVVNFAAYPTTFDPASGRATAVVAVVTLRIALTERATGKLLFSRPGWEFRERYEISVDPTAYFDESGPAMDRLARDVAQTTVSGILENF
jgi:hypothetical protein